MAPRPRTFEELAARLDEEERLHGGAAQELAVLGAALIARDAYAGLDVDALLGRFDELAAPVTRDWSGTTAHERALALSGHVYETLGFAGNEDDYYDPRNSLLSDVLERRLGIPISLAVVYGEVARRAGVTTRGVGFPGHFLLRVCGGPGEDDALVDPFFGGRVLDAVAVGALVRRVAGQASAPAVMRPELLAAATPRAILARWLMNLRGVHLARGDLSRALLAVDRLVLLSPKSAALLRDRGVLAGRLGAVEAARADLASAAALDPSLPGLKDEMDRLGARRSAPS